MTFLPAPLLWAVLVASTAGGATAAEQAGFEALPLVAGELEAVLVEPGDTLLDIAFRRRVGFQALQRLNPKVDPWIPPAGTVILLPTRYLLPKSEPVGLVINVPEMRLYDFTPQEGPEAFAVAVGDPQDPTPLGTFRVGRKRIDPVWRVPESIRQERPELPATVPPGPDNPLGDRWMTVGNTSYGIHGTNVRWSIGREATHGCVRLYADEMRKLFERTPSGTPLAIVYQPFKWGRLGETIYLEAHPDLYRRLEHPLVEALRVPVELGILPGLDMSAVHSAVEEGRGIPVPVGRRPAAAAPRSATSRPTS